MSALLSHRICSLRNWWNQANVRSIIQRVFLNPLPCSLPRFGIMGLIPRFLNSFRWALESYVVSAWTASGLFWGCPTNPWTGGTSSTNGINSLTSWTFAPVKPCPLNEPVPNDHFRRWLYDGPFVFCFSALGPGGSRGHG